MIGHDAHVLAYRQDLTLRALPMAMKMARTMYRDDWVRLRADWPEMQSLAQLGAAAAGNGYDATVALAKKAKFTTYAFRVIASQLIGGVQSGGLIRLPQLTVKGKGKKSAAALAKYEAIEGQIVRSLNQGFWRLPSKRRGRVAEEFTELATLPARTPERNNTFRDWLRGKAVAKALHFIPLRDRVIVESYYLREKDCQEIARELGISRSRVWDLLKRALRRVQQVLARFQEFQGLGLWES